MADWRSETRRAAERYGLDPDVFERQIQQESGFNPTARSPAGALGIAQIMPGTAKGWGVDPLNPRQALAAAAKNMASYVQKYGSYENALRAYNAGPGAIQASHGYGETNAYVQRILNGQDPGASPAAGVGSTPDAGGSSPDAASPAPQFGPSGDYAGVLAQLLGQDQEQAPVSSPIAAPSRVAMPSGFREIASSGPPRQEGGASGASSLLETLRGPDPANGTSGLPNGSGGLGIAEKVAADRKAGRGAANVSTRTGEVIVSPGANREGVDLDPGVLDFVGRVAGIYGQPLTIGTGSNHSQYTVNGNVSAHWGGRGADIPASGQALTRMGQDALIAAGMPEKQARKVKGGLFNVGGVQVIFQTQQGGDHTDHLHVGLRG